MTVAIFQPYFLPYIGYWQLLAMADRFVVYDNIEYTKKGWINRNRFLQSGSDAYFTVPIKKASDFLTVAERQVADDFDRDKLLRTLAASYRKAPQFDTVYPLVEQIVRAPLGNLFAYVHHSLIEVARFLEIPTPMVVSSTIAIDHTLKSEQKVLAICQALGADRYINPVGGQELYSPAAFAAASIRLDFVKPRPITYPQFGGPFVANLSILDVLMFNSKSAVRGMLSEVDVTPAL
jgi:hypothetical protein